MYEEIINVDERAFRLSTEKPLTIEQIMYTISEIRQKLSTQQIQQLAATCISSKIVGQNINMSATPQGGYGTYTVTFYRGTQVVPGTQNPLGTWTGTYTTVPADVGSPISFSVRIVDSCTGSVATVDVCSVIVYSVLTCTMNGCPATSITPQTVNLSVTPTGGSGTFTYAWLIDTVPSGTTNSISPFLNGGNHNIQVTINDAISNQTCTKSCNIIVTCGTITTGFIIS